MQLSVNQEGGIRSVYGVSIVVAVLPQLTARFSSNTMSDSASLPDDQGQTDKALWCQVPKWVKVVAVLAAVVFCGLLVGLFAKVVVVWIMVTIYEVC